ncbi:hypothetical protein ACFLRH_00580 [Actinomycetota bacterium]
MSNSRVTPHSVIRPLIGLARRVRDDESGLSTLEKIGVAGVIIAIISFIPAARGLLGDAYDAVFKQRDAEGEITAFSVAARGILITITALAAFVGTGFFLLYTNVGKRLAFLITGAATFGWLVIGSLLFVVYAPRGIRPASIEGLNAFQVRIPAIALTVGSAILFGMFVLALDRYERETE